VEFITRLFDTSGFPARWYCGSGWSDDPWLGYLHIISDLGVWSAYLAIPCVLGYFVWKRSDLPFRMIFVLFGAFILACGTTHLMEAIIFGWPAYRLAGVIKFFTAVVSWATVVALVPAVPQVLRLRSPEALEREIVARTKAEDALQQANLELEHRVEQRTAQLRQANELLAQEREWFRTTLASVGDAVIATDTQGNIKFLNSVAGKLTGWSEAEAQGQSLETVFRILNERTRQPAENPALRALRENAVVGLSNHTVLVAKDGSERPVDDSAAPIRDEAGQVIGCVLVFRDVTERRRQEERQQRLAADLAEADRRKDEFLATLAHELRNPLAPLRNGLQILKMAGTDSAFFEQARSMMERQLGQMVRLVDDLMDVSRITRNKLELRPERIELAALVENVLESCRPLVEAGHQLAVSLPSEPVVLLADSTRIGQVLSNLLNNAAKYTSPGGQIWLTAHREGDEAVISVRDNGVGIPPEMLERIFEMFVQVDDSLERAQGGLGIGLTLVKRLVEMHGGTVAAHSSGPGQGSEFVVRLPIPSNLPAPTVAAPADGAPVDRPAQLKVLVVDDNRDSAKTLSMLLGLMGHQTRAAHDGLEAVDAAAAFGPDVIFLDLGLPKLDGYDACRRIRQLPQGHRFTIVALTGWGQDDDRRRTAEAGFNDHLVKPVGHAVLTKLLGDFSRTRG
jgi:PAS domain S-box-containing protein